MLAFIGHKTPRFINLRNVIKKLCRKDEYVRLERKESRRQEIMKIYFYFQLNKDNLSSVSLSVISTYFYRISCQFRMSLKLHALKFVKIVSYIINFEFFLSLRFDDTYLLIFTTVNLKKSLETVLHRQSPKPVTSTKK